MKKLKMIFLNFNNENFDYNFDNVLNISETSDFNKIKNIDSKYVIFKKSGTKYKNVNFESIILKMEEENIDLYALNVVDGNNKCISKLKKSGIYDAQKCNSLFLDCFIIKTDLLEHINFKDFDERFAIIDILTKVGKYFQSCEELICKYDDVYTCKENFQIQYDKNWYIDDLKKMIDKVNDENQNYLLSLYLIKLVNNIKHVNSGILNENDLKKFKELSYKFLNMIDDKLLNIENIIYYVNIHPSIIHYIFKLKYKNNYLLQNVNDKIFLSDKNYICDINMDIVIKAINLENNKLHFYCLYDNICEKPIFNIFINNKKESININEIYSDYIIFGETYYKNLSFDFYVDLSNINKIYFESLNGKKLNIVFPLCASRLVNNYKYSYWNIKDKFLISNGKEIKIYQNNPLRKIRNELLFDCEIIKKNKFSPKCIATVLFRLLHFLFKPFYCNKDIWITYDKLYKGGDCGEYFYRYVSDNTNQKIYYIVNKNTKTYNTLIKKYDTVLAFRSLKCMLLSTYATNIFETEFTAISFCGFKPFMANLCKGIFNADIHCIQHGLTMQRISNIQNKLNDNLKYYFIASEYERKNLLKGEFGYTDKNLVLTGIPRFDGLKNNSENTIMLAPTWRVDIASKGKSGEVRGYINNFKETKYFKIFNSLINNKKLINLLEKYSYKLKFVVHPCLVSNISDYDKNKFVEIVSSTDINYEEVLTKCKLMITDYSGVQYDFAYMDKPILYYHNDDLPPSYNDGEMDYDKIGFGDIAKTEEELVNLIINIVKNDCQISTKYSKRISRFFRYRDFNSSKRIYDFMKQGEQL